MKTCRDCNGTGYVEDSSWGGPDTKEVCNTCAGTGREESDDTPIPEDEGCEI